MRLFVNYINPNDGETAFEKTVMFFKNIKNMKSFFKKDFKNAGSLLEFSVHN